MPELPEVETVIKKLNKQIKGLEIIDFKPIYLPIIHNDLNFVSKIVGQKILDIKRIGKYLIFILTDHIMVGHLRMEGKFFIKDLNEKIEKHEHLIFYLSNGKTLRYDDTRKFGRFTIEDKIIDLTKLHALRNVGTDALLISEDEFYNKIIGTNTNIKNFLLNQKNLAGVGNIYANEILFLAKIHPYTKTIQINRRLSDKILKHTKEVLNKAISMGGTTISSFSSDGIDGMFQNELYVHGKNGEHCQICNSIIEKIQISGRGTYFCPGCQKIEVIGLTGGIASGKSTIVDYLRKLKFDVIDSDELVKESYSNEQIVKEVKELFSIKEIDKQYIKKIIIANDTRRKELEDIIHPYVFSRIDELKLLSQDSLIFIDMPLLFEIGYDSKVDRSLLVHISLEEQINRLVKRDNISRNYAKLIINMQGKNDEKLKKASIVIDNSGTKKELFDKIDKFIRGE